MLRRASIAIATCAAAAMAALLAATPVAASPYLYLSGLKGDSTAQGYEGWIEVHSYTLSVNNKGCRGLKISKPVDGASERLFIAASRGAVFEEARLEPQAGAEEAGFIRLRLRQATVNSVELATNAAGETTETLQLSAALVIVEFLPDGAGDGTLKRSAETRMPCTGSR